MRSSRCRSSAYRSSPHPGAFASGADFAAAASSHALQQSRHPLALTLSLKRAALLASITPIITAVALFVFPATALFHLEAVAFAQGRSPVEAPDRLAKFIEEASTRFAVPAHWIRAVIRVESGGDAHAISPRGAMGLMQLMPATWVELSARHGLGLDPFDASDNISAGTAYLKEMHDRFGSAGFLAAYHAGPVRYEQHLATSQPLPPETIAYVTAVTSLLTEEQGERTASRNRRALPWREAPLFIKRVDAP
jgi:soluble lytic murein transglycosylase-like protein